MCYKETERVQHVKGWRPGIEISFLNKILLTGYINAEKWEHVLMACADQSCLYVPTTVVFYFYVIIMN